MELLVEVSEGVKKTREKDNYQKKINKRRTGKMLQWSLLCLFIISVVAVLWVVHSKKVYNTYVDVSVSQLKYTSDNEIVEFEDMILFYNKDGIKCIQGNGTKVWDVVYQMQEPMVSTSGNKVAIADFGGKTIYLMDDKGKISEITTELTMKSIEVSESGMVAAIMDGGEVTWMYIYNSQGEVLLNFRITMNQTGYPLAISMSPNGKMFVASYLGLVDGTLDTSVAFYNFGEVGSNYTDRYVSGYNYVDMLIPVIEFMDDEHAIAIANSRIMFYKGSEKPTIYKEVLINDEIESAYIGEDAVALTYKNVSDEGDNFIQVYSVEGEILLEKGTDFDFTDMEIKNGLLTMYNKNECLVWSFSGVEKYNGTVGGQINKIYATSKKYQYNVITEDEVKVVELR